MTSDSNCLTSIAYAPMSLWRLTVAIHKMFLPVPAPPPPQTLSGWAIDFLELRSEVKMNVGTLNVAPDPLFGPCGPFGP